MLLSFFSENARLTGGRKSADKSADKEKGCRDDAFRDKMIFNRENINPSMARAMFS